MRTPHATRELRERHPATRPTCSAVRRERQRVKRMDLRVHGQDGKRVMDHLEDRWCRVTISEDVVQAAIWLARDNPEQMHKIEERLDLDVPTYPTMLEAALTYARQGVARVPARARRQTPRHPARPKGDARAPRPGRPVRGRGRVTPPDKWGLLMLFSSMLSLAIVLALQDRLKPKELGPARRLCRCVDGCTNWTLEGRGVTTRKMPVRLLRSSLTGRVYAVTSYTEPEPGKFIARMKYDVTVDFNELMREDHTDCACRVQDSS